MDRQRKRNAGNDPARPLDLQTNRQIPEPPEPALLEHHHEHGHVAALGRGILDPHRDEHDRRPRQRRRPVQVDGNRRQPQVLARGRLFLAQHEGHGLVGAGQSV